MLFCKSTIILLHYHNVNSFLVIKESLDVDTRSPASPTSVEKNG